MKSMFYKKGITDEHEFLFSSEIDYKMSVGEFVSDKKQSIDYKIIGVKSVFSEGRFNTDRTHFYIKYLIEELDTDVQQRI